MKLILKACCPVRHIKLLERLGSQTSWVASFHLPRSYRRGEIKLFMKHAGCPDKLIRYTVWVPSFPG